MAATISDDFAHPIGSQPLNYSQQPNLDGFDPPTQVNEDATDLVPSQKLGISSSPENPWAILHSLSSLVPTISLTGNRNRFGIGRHSGPTPADAPFQVDLVISPEQDGMAKEAGATLSRFHAVIQRKGVDEEEPQAEELQLGRKGLLIRHGTLPNNGQNGRIVISLCDHSTNGTFINGKKCSRKKWTKLRHGDEIALGSQLGNVKKPNNAYVWMIAIPSQPKFPMNKLPVHQSEVCKQVYDRYDFLIPLGKGAFATTWKAFDRETGEYRAIKVIKKSDHFDNPQNLINFQREIAILAKVNHPNIVKFYESQEDDDLIWIVLELVDGGEFLDYVCAADGLDEESCKLVTTMLLNAIEYLACLKIAHRDLKPENILMSSGKRPQAKIADFGLAKQLTSRNTNFKTHCGTPAYVAPEVVLPYRNTKGYTVAVDMYSLGVIVYSALANCSPYEGQPNHGDFKEICRVRKVDTRVLADLKPDISTTALDFIDQLTIKDVSKRLTAAQALEHPWIVELASQGAYPSGSLPENPVKTATQPRSETADSALGSAQSKLHPKPRTILASNDLNLLGLNARKADLSPKCSSPFGLSISEDQANVEKDGDSYGQGSKLNAHQHDLAGDVDNSHDIDYTSSEPEMICSQQLGRMKLETPYISPSEGTPKIGDVEREGIVSASPPPLASQSSIPSQFANAIEDSVTSGSMCPIEKSASKRKLRQWSSSPKIKEFSRAMIGTEPMEQGHSVDVVKDNSNHDKNQINIESKTSHRRRSNRIAENGRQSPCHSDSKTTGIKNNGVHNGRPKLGISKVVNHAEDEELHSISSSPSNNNNKRIKKK